MLVKPPMAKGAPFSSAVPALELQVGGQRHVEAQVLGVPVADVVHLDRVVD
jgi:hypothetical protein